MLRKFTVVVGVTLSLLVVRESSAIPVVATDLPGGLGLPIQPTTMDDFTVAMPPPGTMGTIFNAVYFDGINYTYVHTVTPALANNESFTTEFSVLGFTGDAGWSFSNAIGAGGAGTAADFTISQIGGRLIWRTVFGGEEGWDGPEPITFFFVSTNPPGVGDYNLSTSDVGTAQSAAPVAAPIPEPGSIALLGSGLVGLYAAMRRRRGLRA